MPKINHMLKSLKASLLSTQPFVETRDRYCKIQFRSTPVHCLSSHISPIFARFPVHIRHLCDYRQYLSSKHKDCSFRSSLLKRPTMDIKELNRAYYLLFVFIHFTNDILIHPPGVKTLGGNPKHQHFSDTFSKFYTVHTATAMFT